MIAQNERTHLAVIRLEDEIQRMNPEANAAGRRAETLVKSDQIRVVLVTMQAEAVLNSHCAPGPITIHALSGRFDVHVGAETSRLGPGELVAIEPRVRHDVAAVEAGAFLLTIGWPHLMGGDPAIGAI